MDLLTYALAKKKASDELKERLDKIEAATAEAKQSAETSQAAAEQVKDLYEKPLWPHSRPQQVRHLRLMRLARTKPADCRSSSRKLLKRGKIKWLTHGNLSITR